MPISIRQPGWPLLVIDTPEEAANLKAARARAEASLPVIYEDDLNGKRMRIRGYINEDIISGSVCEWFYNNKWLRLKNMEMIDELKERCEAKLNALKEVKNG